MWEPRFSEPLIWCLHGGPGTGKSFVIKLLRRLFTQVLGWEMGVEFQMAALQAVMAEQIGGDTLHHALGIMPSGPQGPAAKESQRQTDVAKRVQQWRWLFIDEISMVSPQLLAEVDQKLRDVVSKIGSMKAQQTGIDLAFGGLNVLFAGDFWQLGPPSGGVLAAVPVEFLRRARQYAAAPTVAHGQSIFWSRGPGCVQGLTELTECVRTDDEWLFQVQSEIRVGALTDESHRSCTVDPLASRAAGSTGGATAARPGVRRSRKGGGEGAHHGGSAPSAAACCRARTTHESWGRSSSKRPRCSRTTTSSTMSTRAEARSTRSELGRPSRGCLRETARCPTR